MSLIVNRHRPPIQGPPVPEHPEVEAAAAAFMNAAQLAWYRATWADECPKRDRKAANKAHNEALVEMTKAQLHLQQVRAKHR